MDTAAIDKALSRVIAVINFRQTKRRSLFESECNMICDDFLEQQSYLISELTNLIQEAEHIESQLKVFEDSNTADPILTNARGRAALLNREVSARRHDSRERRMALRRLASSRQETEYLEDRLVEYLSDTEKASLQAFFTAIVDYYETAEGHHSHDLNSGLKYFEYIMEAMAELENRFTADQKEQFANEVERAILKLQSHRENAQAVYADISALRDKVRIAITV